MIDTQVVDDKAYLKKSKLVEEFYDYLADDKHCILWGDWDITRHDSRQKAAEWYIDQLLEFASSRDVKALL